MCTRIRFAARWAAHATLVAVALLALYAPVSSCGAERIPLDQCCIVADSDQPSYVQYGVADLANYLVSLTGYDVRVTTKAGADAPVWIAVGQRQARQVLGETPTAADLGPEGYLLQSALKDGTRYIVVAGNTPRGTKAGLSALMKRIEVDSHSVFLDSPLAVTSQPVWAKRGLHLNGWAFNYPYTFRGWREQDWQSYLDILAYEGVNLFYLWPFIEIIPVPLSAEDHAYLEECRRVVEYAQQKHGMEVWIMQCTNRVAQDRCGVADPRHRPYWRPSQQDLNPGKPEDLAAILQSRETLYRIVNNVDGVCNIDSDPGYCPGSSLQDYVNVLLGCRRLLDQYNLHGNQAKLVSWMWSGWGLVYGHPGQMVNHEQHQLATIEILQRNLPEPWSLIAGVESYLPLCKKEQVLAKTVFLPYGLIEGEPSYPATNVGIDALRGMMERQVSHYPKLAGMMGNVQTPLLQFPHVHFFTSSMWDADFSQRSERDVLLDLAGHLYPEHQELIANCYLGLKETNPDRIEPLARQLDRLASQNLLGRPGLFTRKLFPDYRIVAQSLVMQLKLSATRERLLQDIGTTHDDRTWTQLLLDACDTYLAWETAHGWHTLWGWGTVPWASDPRFVNAAVRIAQSMGDSADIEERFREIHETLAVTYDDQGVDQSCIVPLKRLILSALPIESLAQKATASASVTPDAAKYPPSAANDGNLLTLYWPGALVENNTQWLQLTWDSPQTFDRVIVRFLQHPSMRGRTIHLQKELTTGQWIDLATTVIADAPSTPHAMATFQLSDRVALDKIRVVNLLDLFEIEVR